MIWMVSLSLVEDRYWGFFLHFLIIQYIILLLLTPFLIILTNKVFMVTFYVWVFTIRGSHLNLLSDHFYPSVLHKRVNKHLFFLISINGNHCNVLTSFWSWALSVRPLAMIREWLLELFTSWLFIGQYCCLDVNCCQYM